jgi:ubiquinone biosynthesis protein UbiJ
MTTTTATTARGQCNFLDFVVGPLHVAILRCFSSQLRDINKQVMQNRTQWGEICAEEKKKAATSEEAAQGGDDEDKIAAELETNQRRLGSRARAYA